mgnify:CR=1 FL=1
MRIRFFFLKAAFRSSFKVGYGSGFFWGSDPVNPTEISPLMKYSLHDVCQINIRITLRNMKQQRKRKSKGTRNKSDDFWDRLSSMVQRRTFTRMRKQIQRRIWLKILNLSKNQVKQEKTQSKGKITKGPRNPRRNRNRDKTRGKKLTKSLIKLGCATKYSFLRKK